MGQRYITKIFVKLVLIMELRLLTSTESSSFPFGRVDMLKFYLRYPCFFTWAEIKALCIFRLTRYVMYNWPPLLMVVVKHLQAINYLHTLLKQNFRISYEKVLHFAFIISFVRAWVLLSPLVHTWNASGQWGIFKWYLPIRLVCFSRIQAPKFFNRSPRGCHSF